MATKVEKRQVRKKQNAQAMGIDVTEIEKDNKKQDKKKKGIFGSLKGNMSEDAWKWFLFFINVLLLMFLLSFPIGK